MTLVAMSASYGAGGSIVGPAVAERLGVPFLDRAIPLAVAEALHVPYDDAAAHDDRVNTSWLERALSGFVGADTGAPSPLPADVFSSEDFQRATEAVLLEQARTGDGVILGRGSVALLRSEPQVLRVRLDGPVPGRVRQAMQLDRTLGHERAQELLRDFDRTHAAYVQQFYGVDISDISLYHLALDSTAIGLQTCVELIGRAAQSLAAGLAEERSSSHGPQR